MNILIDGRVLQHHEPSGIAMYTGEILREFSKINEVEFTLFFSGIKKQIDKEWRERSIDTGIPNKLLHASLLIKKKPTMASFSNTKHDLLFMPHVHFTSFKEDLPVVLTIHDTTFLHHKDCYSLKRNIWHKLINIQKQIDRAVAIICPSHQTKRDIIKYFDVSRQKIWVIPHGVQQQKMENHQKKQRQKYVLYLGTMEPRKNIETIVRGFLQSDLKKQGYTCILAGAKGWGSRQTGAWKSHPAVHYLGYVDEDKKRSLLQHAAAFVYPSFYEGFGLPLLEAMQAGTPIITANRSAMVEVVQDNAILVNPYDIMETARAFNAIIGQKKYISDITTQAKQHAFAYTWRTSAMQHLDVFKHSINEI